MELVDHCIVAGFGEAIFIQYVSGEFGRWKCRHQLFQAACYGMMQYDMVYKAPLRNVCNVKSRGRRQAKRETPTGNTRNMLFVKRRSRRVTHIYCTHNGTIE